MNPQSWTKVGANQSSRLTASQDFWMFDPLKPPSAPLLSRRTICLAYVHSQMNVQMCAKFGANRSSRLTASTDFWICNPLKHPEMPPGILRGELYLAYMSIPRWIRRCVPNLVPIGPAVWQLPKTCDPLNPHGVLRGELYLAYVDSQTNPQICTKFGANRSSRLTASPNICILWPPNPPPPPETPPGVLRGDLYLVAYVHSQMNPQTWTKVGANRTASTGFWIVDPLKPPRCPLVFRGAICLAYIHSHMNLCQIWCQSAQPFGSFSRMCAKVSSAFRRCKRRLPQKHAKKQHL